MFAMFRNSLRSTSPASLAKSFIRLGWAGFWLQLLIGSIPIFLMTYYFIFSRSTTGPRSGLPFVEYLTLVNFAVLAFTILWSLRYIRLGRQLQNPATAPTESKVSGAAWTGLVASTMGLGLTVLLLLIESAHLLYYFLKAPQGGVPVIQTTGAETVSWVSAVDLVSLVSLNLTLMAEVVVLIFSLWLLFRASSYTLGNESAHKATK
ncbi:DUF3611 family protein [bacterium]|nr:DUF3611 family protein [bacterium]